MTVVVAAVTALLVATGTFFGLNWLSDGSVSSTNTPRPASVATIGSSVADGVPVDGSSVAQPDWERVAATVTNSVVAIEVTTAQGEGAGSGVIFSAEGDILTNNHVVSGAKDDTVIVTLSDGRVYPATIVGTDPTTDLAVVRITNPPEDLSPAALGDSSVVTVGQQVMAVGNPLRLQNTVTTGIVSAINRPATTMGETADESVITNAIQVDAAINPGNSGGPLFNGDGKVIGIATSIACVPSQCSTGQTGSIGLGFVIPVNLAKNIASQLVNNPDHTAQHAHLGVRMNDGIAEADGVTRSGAKVGRVDEGTPAAAAGLEAGDVIVAFNGAPVQGSLSLQAFVRSYSPGDAVTLTVVRDGQAMEVDVTLGSSD